ncbi:class I SAM-dependent methyltransferase [Anaerobaca lacustris]|uniref:Class I SAM-dependent methyltransferase n=1 Tax=Anaerobaca lacustris TaxID=3044600 RepID=A0AAW6TPG7_9BACT|nr:class I SAM-dependent methyltransferase [Sedimentisphaerales bacterium M17dextr]
MSAMDYERVARFYDSYVQTDMDVPFFLREAKKAVGPVLELTAGTGRVSIPLLLAGIDVTCVDSSPAMLGVLRDKLRAEELSTEVIQADMCELSLNRRFDLIFVPFHSFAEITDPTQQRQALSRIHDHLSDEGRFICTLRNPPVRLQSVTGRRRELGNFPLPDGNMLSLSSVEYYDPVSKSVSGSQFYDVRRWDGCLLASMTVDLHFCLYSHYDFQSLAEAAGFVPVHLYGDYSYGPFEPEVSPFMIWVLRRVRAETV